MFQAGIEGKTLGKLNGRLDDLRQAFRSYFSKASSSASMAPGTIALSGPKKNDTAR